jgi:hypothetical protein
MGCERPTTIIADIEIKLLMFFDDLWRFCDPRLCLHAERFEFRQVAVGQTFGNLVQITNGLHDGERVVVLGKGPRQ